MPVDYKHPLYAGHEKKAQRVRDAVSGSDAVKGRGETYLPCPSGPLDTLTGEALKEAQARYVPYKMRALWLGVTKRTHDGLLGAVFRKEPEVDLPSTIDYMIEDADGSGMSLEQFAKLVVSHLFKAGRHGVLVDYPEAVDGLTREQTQGLRATLRSYASQSIINWRREGEDLTLVVLHETYEKAVDEFERQTEDQYRVLSLEDGAYVQRVFRDGYEVARSEPRMSNGQRWPVIPFSWFGASTNDETPDAPLLIDIADINLALYRNSADLEESAFIAGQPMLHVDIGDMSSDEWQDLNPNGITVGSRRGIQTKGGNISMVQAEDRNLLLALMEQKQAQLLSIGARLIEQRGQNETAEAVRARSGAENSNLSTVATNVSDGLRNALEWALAFMGGTGEIKLEINQQFYSESAEPQEVMSYIQMVDRGLAADTDFWTWARKRGLIDPDRTDEDLRADADAGGANIGAM